MGRSYAKEARAVAALAAARGTVRRTCRVVRSGAVAVVDACEIVPGDLLALSPGDVVPAECRLREGAVDLKVGTRVGGGADFQMTTVRPGDVAAAGRIVLRGEARAAVMRTARGGAKSRAGPRPDADAAGVTRTNTHRLDDDHRLRDVVRGIEATAAAAAWVLVALTTREAIFSEADGGDGGGSPFGVGALFSAASYAATLLVAAAPIAVRAACASIAASACDAMARRRVAPVGSHAVFRRLATVDVVCCPSTGVFTRAGNGLELRAVHVTVPGVSPHDVLVAAALATRWTEPPRDEVDAMVLRAVDVGPLSDSYNTDAHSPFDAHNRRSESTLRRRREIDPAGQEGGSSRFRTCKGAPDAVLPACDNAEDVEAEVSARLNECAAAGYRCLAVAANHLDPDAGSIPVEGGDESESENSTGWTLIGLLSYRDPIRSTVRGALARATRMGLRVVTVTGAAAMEARVVCRALGRPAHVIGPEDIATSSVGADGGDARGDAAIDVADGPMARQHVSTPEQSDGHPVDAAAALAEADAKARAAMTAALRRRGRRVAVIGRRVSDIEAMAAADVAVAAHDAADAAVVDAADVVLAAPGLDVVTQAISTSRAAFARMRNVVVARAASAVHLAIFISLATLVTAPRAWDDRWPATFQLPVAALAAMACLHDAFGAAALARDHGVLPSRRPERWPPPRSVALLATVVGGVAAASSLLLLWTLLAGNTRGSLLWGLRLGPLTYGQILGAVFLHVSLQGHLTALCVRVVGPCYEQAPGGLAGAVVGLGCVASTTLAVAWPFGASTQMEAVTAGQACFVWGYALIWVFLQDSAKVATYRVLHRAGWLPVGGATDGGDEGRHAGCYGGAALTPAEVSAVEDAAADAVFDPSGGTLGGPTEVVSGRRRRGRADATGGSGRRRGSHRLRARRWAHLGGVYANNDDEVDEADEAERGDAAGGMLVPEYEYAEPWAGLDDDGGSDPSWRADGETERNDGRALRTRDGASASSMDVDGYQAWNGWRTGTDAEDPEESTPSEPAARMTPEAGADFVEHWVSTQLPDVSAETVAAFEAPAAKGEPGGGHVGQTTHTDPVAAAAAAAGLRLRPAPQPSLVIAAAAAAAARAGARTGGMHPPPTRSSSSPDDAGEDRYATDAEAAAEDVVPRADRLRLAPDYVVATADDYAHLVRARDWRGAFASMAACAASRGDAALAMLDVGCGGGAFLAALAASGALLDPSGRNELGMPVEVDLLDPSPCALRAAAASVAPPMVLQRLHCATVQDYAAAMVAEAAATAKALTPFTGIPPNVPPAKQYDVVLVVHALSSVPAGVGAGGLAAALRAIRSLLRPGGFGFIAAAAATSHTARFHALYHREFGPGSSIAAAAGARGVGGPAGPGRSAPTALTTAEHVVAALTARGVAFNRADHAYITAVPCEERGRVEAFLHGCAGDDAVSLDTMLANPRVGAYLVSCRTPDGARYTFPQKVAHITL